MANISGTNIPDIPSEDWASHLSADITDFLASTKGPDVRAGFTDIAYIIANLVLKQAISVTDIFDNPPDSAAAQAKAVGDEFKKALRYRGTLSTTNLNLVTTTGVWMLDSSISYENAVRNGTVRWFLCVQTEIGSVLQMIVAAFGNVYTRRGLIQGEGADVYISWDADWGGGIDNELTDERGAANAKVVGDAISQLLGIIHEVTMFGAISLFNYTDKAGRTHNGVTFAWDDDANSYRITGTPTGSAFYNVWEALRGLPDGFEVGKTYDAAVKTTNSNIFVEIYYYIDGVIQTGTPIQIKTDGKITIPAEADPKVLVRLYVAPALTGIELDETISFAVCDTDIALRQNMIVTNQIDHDLHKYGTINLFNDTEKTGRAHNGVTFAWDDDANSYRITGTPTGSAFYNVWAAARGLPDGFEVGKTYDAIIKTTNPNIFVEIYYYIDGVIQTGTPIQIKTDGKITIPAEADPKVLVRLYVAPALTGIELDETISFAVVNQMGGNVYNNEYIMPVYNNTYNISAQPTITADTNNYLASTNDTTDRTADIQSMLSQNGVCNLGAGDFYVSGVTIPTGGTLKGSGKSTRLVLISTVSQGAAVKIGTNGTLADMSILGSTAEYTPVSSVGTRHGVLFEGLANQDGAVPYRSTLHNLTISNFNGGGITWYNTGYSYAASLNVSDCFIYKCDAGIDIAYWAEFNRITNVSVDSCYYGCVNNGGNNVLINCGFNGNTIGVLMDNETGQSPNSAHGSFVGCTINHSGNNSGIALKITGMSAGEVFTACQFFYGRIEIVNSSGVHLDSCNFGNSVSLYVDGYGEKAGLVLLTACIFKTALQSVEVNGAVVVKDSCYLRDGTPVT